MSPVALRKGLEKYKALNKLPKAVVVVHLYGLTANINEIKAICDEYGVALVEDAAESLGTTVNGKYTGTFGDYGIISFNGNKIITTSGGGMLLVNTKDASDKAKKVLFWSTQAREQARHYEHKEIGYNYRMSNVVAGIGRGQLKVLNKRIEKKRYIYEYYQRELGHLEGFSLMHIAIIIGALFLLLTIITFIVVIFSSEAKTMKIIEQSNVRKVKNKTGGRFPTMAIQTLTV